MPPSVPSEKSVVKKSQFGPIPGPVAVGLLLPNTMISIRCEADVKGITLENVLYLRGQVIEPRLLQVIWAAVRKSGPPQPPSTTVNGPQAPSATVNAAQPPALSDVALEALLRLSHYQRNCVPLAKLGGEALRTEHLEPLFAAGFIESTLATLTTSKSAATAAATREKPRAAYRITERGRAYLAALVQSARHLLTAGSF